ncbi:sporulation integral membrane protein YtvI [Lottiidibacillus patelloidae]|uniref:Sporulation integral membrane protein YtvI n=1 Tax=Lottiidibacillus patelloidae TaxID=2670334 RepID=A0A263BW32_9BACI|nr:sporulation integral membrane protein YtvI [Lottiidibacillus patelloidae]OZM57953.1 sporulation integral membrane protein YtvI [Lottiidibacillus patelloidae]
MNANILYSSLRLLFVIATIIVSLYGLFYVSTVTYPFLIAIIIAFLINPIVNFLEKKTNLPRYIAVIVTIVVFLAAVFGIMYLLVAEIVAGTAYLVKVVPPHFQKLVEYIQAFFVAKIVPIYNDITAMIRELDQSEQDKLMNNINEFGATVVDGFSTILITILGAFQSLLLGLPNAATVLIFSLLATFFISKDWYRLGDKINNLIPASAHKSSQSVINELKKAFFGFIKAQFTLISITAVIVLIGLLILRVEYAITIAIIIGIVDLLPYLGTGAVFVPWIIYTFITGDYPTTIGLAILYIIVVVQRQVMEPKILSSNIGLDPLATLVALFVGFKLFGFLGLIIGPVLLVIINALQSAGVFENLWNFIIGKTKTR